MVSTRPSPAPAKGRIAYPTAATYTPGDGDDAPTYTALGTSQDSGKTWWKGAKSEAVDDGPVVFGVSLAESIKYASVQISTAGVDGKLYVWG